VQDSLRAVILSASPEELYSLKPLEEIFGAQDASGMGLEEIHD
jgi:hypothetical protein